MKTKNNVQKTILRSVAVLLSFVLISITVSAQDFWKKFLTNSSFNEIAIAMVKTTEQNRGLNTDKIETGSAVNEKMDNETYFLDIMQTSAKDIEDPLELENWMISDNWWNN